MSASSQYYKVTSRVGVPHRHSVEVTVPLVGPVGPAGPQGAQGPPGEVSGSIAWDNVTGKPTIPAASSSTPQPIGPAAAGSATTYARGDHRHAHYTLISQEALGTLNSPTTISVTSSQVPAKIVISSVSDEPVAYARVVLPAPPDTTVHAMCSVRVETDDNNNQTFLQVAQGQGEAMYPASGYDEIEFNRDYIFRWNGNRWDMDFSSNNDTVSREIYRPPYGCTLAGFVNKPATPTSTGVAGQLAWGYDDGAERLYICVASNVWRRTTISTWT
jgi:hypothetical protein